MSTNYNANNNKFSDLAPAKISYIKLKLRTKAKMFILTIEKYF